MLPSVLGWPIDGAKLTRESVSETAMILNRPANLEGVNAISTQGESNRTEPQKKRLDREPHLYPVEPTSKEEDLPLWLSYSKRPCGVKQDR